MRSLVENRLTQKSTLHIDIITTGARHYIVECFFKTYPAAINECFSDFGVVVCSDGLRPGDRFKIFNKSQQLNCKRVNGRVDQRV